MIETPKEVVKTSQAPQPKGAYSQGVKANNYLFLAAQGPFDPKSGAIVGCDIESQTRRTLENVKAILGASGFTLHDVVMVWAFLKHADDSKKMDEIYKSYFPENPPARTVLVSQVPTKEALIAMDAIAYRL